MALLPNTTAPPCSPGLYQAWEEEEEEEGPAPVAPSGLEGAGVPFPCP